MKYHFLKALCLTAIGVFSTHADTNAVTKNHILDTDSLAYAQSLNTTAALVMNWYGNRIDDKQYSIAPLFTDSLQKKHQDDYPDNLIGITLEKAGLKTTDKGLVFSVSGQLQFDKNGEIYQKPLTDSFQFQRKSLTQIQSINIAPTDDVVGVTDKHRLNDKGYYQSRGFAYAWLAYLNGVKEVESWINLADWHNTVDYQLTDRGNTEQGSLTDMLKKSQQQLGGGRYLLKKMNVIRNDQKTNQGTITLSIDFVGEEDSIPTIGNIQQTIKYQIDENGYWKIIRINEKHLIPNPQPWQEILC